MKKIALLVAFAGLTASGVQAAEPVQLAMLSNVDGKVLVNKGSGFSVARSGTALVDGDRLVSLTGARAAVVYQDGCIKQLPENSVLSLDKIAGCTQEAVKTGRTEQPLRYAQAIGGTQTDVPPGGGGGGGGGGMNPLLLGAGGLLGLAAINELTRGKGGGSDNPISAQ